MTGFNDLGRAQPKVVSRQLVATVNATREGRMISQAEKSGPLTPLVPEGGWRLKRLDRSALSEKISSQLRKRLPTPEIIKQNQGFEISRLLLSRGNKSSTLGLIGKKNGENATPQPLSALFCVAQNRRARSTEE
jgi:hypothetical protein